MSSYLQGASKGSRRVVNALVKGDHDQLLSEGLTLDRLADALATRQRGATKPGVLTCLQGKISDGQLVVGGNGRVDRVRRCNRRPAIAAVPA